VLSSKAGKEAFVEPLVDGDRYKFLVKTGVPDAKAQAGTSAGKRKAFICLVSGSPIGYDYIRTEAKAGRMSTKLMSIVAEGPRGRVFLAPTAAQEETALSASPDWRPDCEMPKKHRNFQPPVYGMNNLGDVFTARQLVALNTLSDLVQEAVTKCERDALAAGVDSSGVDLNSGGSAHARMRKQWACIWRSWLIRSQIISQPSAAGTHPNTQMRSGVALGRRCR